MPATPRRRQTAITIRSVRAAERLALLTRDGRSQAQVIEEALDRMPLPVADDRDQAMAAIRQLLARLPNRSYPAVAELDAGEFDDDGNCR